MAQPSVKMDDRYTWDDYLGWPEGERWELIGGSAHAMSPSPASEQTAYPQAAYLRTLW